MPLRPPAGFIRPGYDPLKVPDAPTGASATGGDASASVSFTPPSNVGGSAVSAYYAVSNPDQITATGASSPVSVTGLTNGTSYTFQVWALNTYGPGPWSAASGSVTPVNPRGLFAGGYTSVSPYRTNAISYVTIGTTGNATDFGDLTDISDNGSACSSSTRGVFYLRSISGGGTNTMEYVTIAATGNSLDFGDLYPPNSQGTAGGCSNQTRGLFAGAYADAATWNVIAYITIATTGNSTDFGDLTIGRGYIAALTNTTRAVFGGGSYVSGSAFYVNVLDYVTIASAGNATDFGDMTQGTSQHTACSSSTRGVFAGGTITGGTLTNVIQYITTASAGNATDFGDLSAAKRNLAGCSSPTRAIFGGGYTTTSINVIDYITIATTGNASDFGDLLENQSALMACSNAHGGL